MLSFVLRLLARLPLKLFYVAGGWLGWLIDAVSPRYAARLRENLRQSGLLDSSGEETLLSHTIAEAGRGVLELIPIWFGQTDKTVALVREVVGWEHVEAAMARGKGIIFLTPHLGCFEISALYAAQHFPMTVLYRPPKLAWLQSLMAEGRGGLSLAPADLRGVRILLRALKRGQAVGLLPDQVPGVGEGVWANFFGRPAYTMTLVARLAEVSNAAVLFAFARRLSQGRGYQITIASAENFPQEATAAAQWINHKVEALVRTCPAQYLWSYNRYKTPAGAPDQRMKVEG